VILLLIVAFLLAAGTTFVIWPDKIRDWSIKTGRIPESSWRYRIMFGRGYIFSWRLVGAAWIGFGLFLLATWLGVPKSN
jgi:hypothetical protein